jgi:serine/threonine protein kinase
LSLPPGTRLGPYEIVAPLGAGGMGEVYRATDSNLKRSVAIKVLPASVAGDADRLARFQREAEVLAALNHPNIAAIYGFERSSDLTALVMELVEGEDLSQRIARGAIPITRKPAYLLSRSLRKSNPFRCHRMRISGFTTDSTCRQSTSHDKATMMRVPSSARRGFTCRSTYNANCLRRNRFSAASWARDRSANDISAMRSRAT